MNSIPPDWKDDAKLWKALGSLPQEKVPSNFAWMVRQKLAEEKSPVRRPGFSIFSIFRGWAGGAALATACLALALVLFHNRGARVESPAPAILSLASEADEPVEMAQLAQHYELIQDIEVIEELDELL